MQRLGRTTPCTVATSCCVRTALLFSNAANGRECAEDEEEGTKAEQGQTPQHLWTRPPEILSPSPELDDPQWWDHVGDVGGSEGADEIEDGLQAGHSHGDEDDHCHR